MNKLTEKLSNLKQPKGFSKYTPEILKTTFNIAWPSVVESVFVSLASMIDSFMVSSLGASAVAAVGLTTQPKFLGLAIFIAINISVSALVARRRGEKRPDDANRILITALTSIILLSVLISILCVAFANEIITFCGSNEDTHESAVTYFRVIMGGMIFNTISMGINAAQRGAGNTKITMRTNLVSSGVNIIFNYLLIEGHLGFPALGMFGAAFATVLGTAVAAVMSVISILDRKGFISFHYILQNKIRPALSSIKSIIKIGYSVLIEQVFLRAGFFATALMAANQGTEALAAHQVGLNILGLTFSFGDGLQAAAVALIGRSLGEKNPELAKTYGSTCQLYGLVISIVLMIAYAFFGHAIYSAFFEEESIIAIGVNILYIVVFISFFQLRQVITAGALRGAGDTFYTALVGMIAVTIVRTAVSYIGAYILDFGIIGIWFGVLADQLTRFIMFTSRYRKGKWVKIKI